MKTRMFRIIAASFAWLALTVGIHAAVIQFVAPQFSSGYLSADGIVAFDNPNSNYSASGIVYPASSIAMVYTDPFGGCEFAATVDTSAAKGQYYIGTFDGGADCFVYIY